MNITVKQGNDTKVFARTSPVLLSEFLREEGFNKELQCGGTGKCGKCLVKAFGELSDKTETEKKFFACDEHKRLACQTFATGDCTIITDCEKEYTGVSEFEINCSHNPITGDKNTLAGVVDIGTTTVAVYAFKMPECELIDSKIIKNPQISFGADVISRLTHASVNSPYILYKQINNAINGAFESINAKPEYIVATGNTAMLHFYKNLNCEKLSSYPFEPSSFFGVKTKNEAIPRCISAFVGADITCGIIASGMLENNRSMLIDIGTNGEIAYKNGEKIICCSAAAGPAFEGAGIKNGLPSVPGAINRVYGIGRKFEYTTIGNKKPEGICGSGLLDAVAAMLQTGIIDTGGYLDENFYIGDSKIFITPQDIRAVQNAKGAIRAAIETVCDDIDEVEKFYISGSFGKYMNISSAEAIGLLPKNIKNRVKIVGNSSAAGAAMILFDKDNFEKANIIAESAETLQLAANEKFVNNYMKYMNFNV